MKKKIGLFAVAGMLAAFAFPQSASSGCWVPSDQVGACDSYVCLGGFLKQGGHLAPGAPTCYNGTSGFFGIWCSHDPVETALDRTAYLKECPGSGAVQGDISSIIASFGTQPNPPPF